MTEVVHTTSGAEAPQGAAKRVLQGVRALS